MSNNTKAVKERPMIFNAESCNANPFVWVVEFKRV